MVCSRDVSPPFRKKKSDEYLPICEKSAVRIKQTVRGYKPFPYYRSHHSKYRTFLPCYSTVGLSYSDSPHRMLSSFLDILSQFSLYFSEVSALGLSHINKLLDLSHLFFSTTANTVILKYDSLSHLSLFYPPIHLINFLNMTC